MCSRNYVDLGAIIRSLDQMIEWNLIAVDANGDVEYKKKKKEKKKVELPPSTEKKRHQKHKKRMEKAEEIIPIPEPVEEEPEEPLDDEELLLMKNPEYLRYRTWIEHPHNTPKHLVKLIICLSFFTQKKVSSPPQEISSLALQQHLLIPLGEANGNTKCKYNFAEWNDNGRAV